MKNNILGVLTLLSGLLLLSSAYAQPELYKHYYSNLYANLFGGMGSAEIKVELEKSEKEYEARFGQKADLYYLVGFLGSFSDGLSDKDRILLLKYALKNNKPYPRKHFFGGEVPFPFKEKRGFVKDMEICTARYEMFFNRKIPYCQYIANLCNNRPTIQIGSLNNADCTCDGYLEHILCMATAPFPDSVIVTKLDLWIAIYQIHTSKRTFPSWFQELSYENKLKCLESRISDLTGFMQPFISREEEDSIKVELKKRVVADEKKLGRKITEIEKIQTEFKIQCERKVQNLRYLEMPTWQYSDKELLMAMKYMIRTNRCYWLEPDDLKYIQRACMQ